MSSRLASLCLIGLPLALRLTAQTLPNDSPFLPPPETVTAPDVDSAAGYQLSGMTVVGTETLLSLTRESDKRSTWIAVGKTIGEITVVSYDATNDRAVIRIGGREHTLTLRKPNPGTASVSPLLPPDPANTGLSIQSSATAVAEPPLVMPPLSPQEEKEMEARMLVTDLLEIGQRQRKAYAEAKREAARKAAEAARAAAEAEAAKQ